MPRHHFKEKRRHRVEMMIQRELARAEELLDQNLQAMSVLSRQLDNEPKALAKAFAEIEQKGAGK
jgi:hypothetical protein